MRKVQYSLIMTIGFGLISQTVQQFDDNLPNPNHPFPNNGDYFPRDNQPSLKQVDIDQAGHLPSRAIRHLQDYDNLPRLDGFKDTSVITHIPPIPSIDTQVNHQIIKKDDQFPGPDDIKYNVFPTHTPPRENSQVNDDVNGILITTIPSINHKGEGPLQFPHPDTRTGPRRQIDNDKFPDSIHPLPELDDAQKNKILPINIPPLDNQFGNPIDSVNFPASDDRLPNDDIGDGRTFTNLPPYIVPQFDKSHGNQEHQKTSALCYLGENKINSCHEKCNTIKGDDNVKCYCSGSCDSSNLLMTCKCENPTCECKI